MDARDRCIAAYKKVLDVRKDAKYCYLNAQPHTKRGCRWGDLSADMMLTLLDYCNVGDGDLYESMVMDVIGRILSGIVDCELARQQVPVAGGFCDIEFPICTEIPHGHRLWYEWIRYYEMRSLLVEVKNMAEKASYEDVSQLQGYLSGARMGRLGVLVSRSGFTSPALSRMSALASAHELLILPLDHDELKTLLRFSKEDVQNIMRYLRRKENTLCRLNERPARD